MARRKKKKSWIDTLLSPKKKTRVKVKIIRVKESKKPKLKDVLSTRRERTRMRIERAKALRMGEI